METDLGASHPGPYDAIVLAGGRSSRLGGIAKAGLMYDGASLLERAIRAVRGARQIVVVGPRPDRPNRDRPNRDGPDRDRPNRDGPDRDGPDRDGPGTAVPDLPAGVRWAREDPPFGGPAAAVAAGLAALDDVGSGADWVLVLGCDMPVLAPALEVLLAAAGRSAADGVLAVDGGRTQPLAAAYRTSALRRAVQDRGGPSGLSGLSFFRLIASLHVEHIPVPPGATADVDTWADARVLGIGPESGTGPGTTKGP